VRLGRRAKKAKQLATDKLYWIANGELIDSLAKIGLESWDEAALLDRKGLVRVTTGPQGTTVRWSVFAGNWSSLYFAMDWLLNQQAPITLQYYLMGWFIETMKDPHAARQRIHSIMSKSDVHLQSRTFVKEVPPAGFVIPDLLGDAMETRNIDDSYSIDCVYDEASSRFKVTRIGENSMIAHLWGIEPVSYPCINGGSYDQVVSAIYPEVIRTGMPAYTHVYAAMAFPNSPVRWFPYQRVILPKRFADGEKGVTVVSKAEPVDIEIV
jgi:hypothetical protein